MFTKAPLLSRHMSGCGSIMHWTSQDIGFQSSPNVVRARANGGRFELREGGADAAGPVLSGAEPTEPFVEILGIRSLSFNSRYINAESLHPFKPVLQHRPVNLAQDILTYVDTQIRRDPKDIFVVR